MGIWLTISPYNSFGQFSIFLKREKNHTGHVWGIIIVLSLAKYSRTNNEVWAGALSWCKNHKLFRHDSGLDCFSGCDSTIVHNHFFHFFQVFIGCWCAPASRAFLIFNMYRGFLETLKLPVTPLVYSIWDIPKNLVALYSNFITRFNIKSPILLIHIYFDSWQQN